jgi:hypothetical protein
MMLSMVVPKTRLTWTTMPINATQTILSMEVGKPTLGKEQRSELKLALHEGTEGFLSAKA